MVDVSKLGETPPDLFQDTDLHRMVSEAAYYLAEQRGFQGAYTLDDWLAAEKEVRRLTAPGATQEVSNSAKFAATQAAGDGVQGDVMKQDKTVDEKIAANMADRK